MSQEEKRGRRRSSHIDVSRDDQCRYWAERLGVYPGELKAAVWAVGDDLDDLWRYIDEQKHEPEERARIRHAPQR